ncbi:MAG: hypothetical protein R2795_09350 [Saprospiraceae bacterium]
MNLEYSIDGGNTWQSSNVFTGLGSGNYAVVVREVGTLTCTDAGTASLTAPSAPSIDDLTVVDASDCGVMDGSITVMATGGTLEYSIDGINWQSSPVFNNLAGGTYTVTVRDANSTSCTVVDMALVGGPDVPQIISVTATNPTDCGVDDGTITIVSNASGIEYSIDGGSTFQTSGIFTNLAAGDYDIVVRFVASPSCVDTDMVTLDPLALPILTDIVVTSPTDCGIDDGSVTIMATGSNLEYSIDGGATWQASNVFNGLPSGVYNAIVRTAGTNGCTAMGMATLEMLSQPIITAVTATDPTGCTGNDGTITIVATGSNLEYSIDGGASWQAGMVFNGLSVGQYEIEVRVTGTANCVATENASLMVLEAPVITNISTIEPTDCVTDDGSISITATGNMLEYSIDGGLTWQLSNVFTGLSSGAYEIVVRIVGTQDCTDTGMAVLNMLASPVLTALTATNATDCGVTDGTITVTATGGDLEYSIDGVNWQNSNAFTGLAPGDYTVSARVVESQLLGNGRGERR